MAAQMRSVAGPVLCVLLAFWGFGMAGDRAARPVKGRAPLEAIAPAGPWSAPGPYERSSRAVQSRGADPRLQILFPAADAYRLRIFYKLEGKAPGEALIGGQAVARLEPGGWSRAGFISPLVRQGEPLGLAFRVPGGSKLILRRVDFQNYLVRAGSLALLKPAGGRGVPPSPGQTGLFLFALVFLGACLSLAGRGRREGEALDGPFWRWCGGAAGLLVLHQWLSPYPLHAQPAALGAAFLAVSCTGVLARLAGGGRVLLRRAGLAAAGVLIALLIAEGALRIWDPPISRPRIGSYAAYSEDYGWMNRPGAEGWQVDIRYHIRLNRFGHRGGDYPEKKPEGEFRILGLGDSFAFGWGVAEEDTFLKVVERRLRAAGRRVRVMNAAVPAWHSSQSLHYLLREGLRFEPDLVVMSFFMDDVFPAQVDRFRRSAKARELRAEEASLRRKKSAASLRLYSLWFNYRKLLRAGREQRRLNPYPTFEAERERILSVSSQRDFEQIGSLREGLDRMIGEWEKAREAHRLPIVFTFIPAGGALGHPELQGDARALRRASLARGVPYVDAVSRLERQPDPRRLYLHPRDGHMSAAGHAVVGEAIAERILKEGWLKGGPADN